MTIRFSIRTLPYGVNCTNAGTYFEEKLSGSSSCCFIPLEDPLVPTVGGGGAVGAVAPSAHFAANCLLGLCSTELNSSMVRPLPAHLDTWRSASRCGIARYLWPWGHAALPLHHCLPHLHKPPTNYSLLFDNLTIIHFLSAPQAKNGVDRNIKMSGL
jgi:hypothetical protein